MSEVGGATRRGVVSEGGKGGLEAVFGTAGLAARAVELERERALDLVVVVEFAESEF